MSLVVKTEGIVEMPEGSRNVRYSYLNIASLVLPRAPSVSRTSHVIQASDAEKNNLPAKTFVID